MRDQAEKLRQIVQNSRESPSTPVIKQAYNGSSPRVITVTSGKGGVGKTNFTVNLALTLGNMGQQVLVIDADLGMANVDVVLGCSAPYSILNLLEDRFSVDDVVSDGPCGIKFMTGGSGIYQLANLSNVQLQRIINQITLFDNWADFVLIDTGAGINRNVLNFVMAADEVIILTTPEPTAITDAYAMMKAYAGNGGAAPLSLVVNRVQDAGEGQMVVDKLNKATFRFLGFSVNSLGFVNEDPAVVKAVKKQVPFILSYPQAASTRCIENIARKLLHGEALPETKGFRGFMSRMLQSW
ncbi:MinD/ParA family protein [Acetonema longum]|uniref:Cobyrinic acid ac-diamide synthase n=1 Tax=Acetonema longum DSM 6540 TaxID=1009370 RepID=F7NL63_9FIRM|nr:MinD/ParA family protein [Acetonema longum]EGO63168.1 Cobyrinic acid ac-diamide synthase [Acetonema longum DSM 6540]